MGYYRLIDGPGREALATALDTARHLADLHPEYGSEDDG